MKATMTGVLALAGVALAGVALAGVALAEVPAFGVDGSAGASPFAFAQSGAKAARSKQQAQAGGGKVIGGQEATAGAWPWQVALLVAGQPVGPDAQFCGGSLVLDQWVLTAAHCVHMADASGTFGDIDPQSISVLVGSQVLAPGQGDVVPVAAIYRHPDYVGTVFDYDIALIRLARAPQAAYATVDVPDAEFGDQLDSPGVITVVTGWGLTEGGARPETLRQTEIQMLDRGQCNAALLEARAEEAAKGFGYAAQVFGLPEQDAYDAWDALVARVPPAMSANMLCSGTYEGGKTACSGDSGGPLVVPLADGSYVQAGVVSWGLSAQNGQGCEETAKFSAYTRISNFLPWLNGVISANP